MHEIVPNSVKPKEPDSMNKRVNDMYYIFYKMFGSWLNPMTHKPFTKSQAKFIYNTNKQLLARAMQVREECLATQRLSDRSLIFTESSKVDITTATDSCRTTAGIELKVLLGVRTIVIDRFVLPDWIRLAVKTQLNSDMHNDRFDNDTGLYEIFGRILSSVKISARKA